MIIAAFDPGLSGAVAIVDQRPPLHIKVVDLPIMGLTKQTVLNGAELAELLRSYDIDHAVVEHVHAFPGQGVAGMFRFGTAFGQILGILQALEISYELVHPAVWKRAMKLPGGIGKGEVVRARALQLYPKAAADLSRKKDHNRAEALLLARWWMEKNNATSRATAPIARGAEKSKPRNLRQRQ